jgi:hypothetical protein
VSNFFRFKIPIPFPNRFQDRLRHDWSLLTSASRADASRSRTLFSSTNRRKHRYAALGCVLQCDNDWADPRSMPRWPPNRRDTPTWPPIPRRRAHG